MQVTASGMLTCRYFSVMEVGLSFISSAATLAFEKLKNVKLESDAIIWYLLSFDFYRTAKEYPKCK